MRTICGGVLRQRGQEAMRQLAPVQPAVPVVLHVVAVVEAVLVVRVPHTAVGHTVRRVRCVRVYEYVLAPAEHRRILRVKWDSVPRSTLVSLHASLQP